MKIDKTVGSLVIVFALGFVIGMVAGVHLQMMAGSGVGSMEAPASLEVEMIVTAYCKDACCCGKYADGFTASGKPAVGLIIAAPPKYPFGTIMDVPGYGVAVVADRGGAIKGNKIDLLFPSHQEALAWGVKKLRVRVLK